MATIVISDLTHDVSQFVDQFQTYLSQQPVWKGTLTTQTSQTLVELIASVGTFNEGRVMRAFEDAFSETAQSDDAIRAAAQMQGIRMSRKLPAAITIQATSDIDDNLTPMAQFMVAGQYYFNRDQLTFAAGVAQTITLYQGKVQTYAMNGLGSARQTFITEEDVFSVSDQDVRVYINSTLIPKCFGTMWNYTNLPAFADLTTADGRLLVVFGSEQFGSIPAVTDNVVIQYAVTDGVNGSNRALLGKPVQVDGVSTVNGIVTTNPTGGGDEQPIETYKNLSSGAFGTYSSAVTKSQYLATVGIYPGIIDSVTQAQRDINPMDLKWMNVIRISALTNTPWSQDQKTAYLEYLQTVTMYAPRYVWQDPIPVYNDIEVSVYCFNTAVLSKVKADCEAAILALFAPRPGLLQTNFYEDDLSDVCRKVGNGAVSYVIVKNPTDPMIVTEAVGPTLNFEVVAGAGTLSELVYAYGIATVDQNGKEGTPKNWVFPQVIGNPVYGISLTWEAMQNVTAYKIYGRKGGSIGLLATVLPTQPLTFVDDGSVVPGATFVSSQDIPIRYNAINTLKVNVDYAERQQRLSGTPTRGLT